jgi:hypothetical protein
MAFLRPEARPVPYDRLQRRAQEALDLIIEALKAAQTAAKNSESGGATATGSPFIDKNRASRLFFISGEPGSGKSTLYLTLAEMLGPEGEKYRGEKQLQGLGPVRWLDTLDLEVAGDEGENLLAAVAVRLIRAIEVPDTVLSKPCADAIRKLEELATDIGIAWDGNLRARASALDPDTYSEEVMRAQRARLGINEHLRGVLNALAKNKCCGCDDGTLFVLPVDDLYLKPHVSLQLLRLLRMISVPRLFFLVMGDITTVEALFIEKSLADWTAVAGAKIFAILPRRLEDALASARELRARYLRKLLPPGQRTTIEAMDWHEALTFRPELVEGKNDHEALENLLEVNLDDPKEWTTNTEIKSKTTLLEYLISPSWEKAKHSNEAQNTGGTRESGRNTEDSPSARKQKNEAREAYTALQILDATPREIVDLWLALYKLKPVADGKKKNSAKADYVDAPPPLLSQVMDFVKLELEEQNFLREEQQSIFVNNVLPTRHYSPRDIQFNMDRLTLEPDPNPWRCQSGLDETDRVEPRVWVRKHRSWKLAAEIGDSDYREAAAPFAKLPPRQTAWMVLLHDLAWRWSNDSITGNLVEGLCKRLDNKPFQVGGARRSSVDDNTQIQQLRYRHLVALVESSKVSAEEQRTLEPEEVTAAFQGWAVWRDGSTYAHFPMPKFETFADLDRFLYIWSTGLEWLHQLQKSAERLQNSSDYARKQTHEARKDKKSEKEAGASRAQQLAREAKEQIGTDERKQVGKYVDLWELSGWVVINSHYEDFAERGDDWFEAQLALFRKEGEANERGKNWQKEIENFSKRVNDSDPKGISSQRRKPKGNRS